MAQRINKDNFEEKVLKSPLPGFSYQQFEKFDSSEEILAHIREEIGEPGKNPDGE